MASRVQRRQEVQIRTWCSSSPARPLPAWKDSLLVRIRDALVPEDRGDFDAAYAQALEVARQTLDLTALFETLEQWRRIAVLQSDRDNFRRVAQGKLDALPAAGQRSWLELRATLEIAPWNGEPLHSKTSDGALTWRSHLADVIDRAHRDEIPTIITRRGHQEAVIVDIGEYQRLRELAERAEGAWLNRLADEAVSEGLDGSVALEEMAAAIRAHHS